MTSYKRKSDYINDSSHDSHHSNQHKNKKHRSENGQNGNNHVRSMRHPSSHVGLSQNTCSSAFPTLPPISREYEKVVFTHPSIAADPSRNYERLEFLGDAQIELIASIVIFDRYTNATPGKMSTIREKFVNNETLAEYSRLYGFDKKVKISPGAYQPKDFTKIHGDVFEAYVAAVILSDVDRQCGFESATRWLTTLWEPRFKEFGLKLMAARDIQSKELLARSLLVKGAKINYKEVDAPVHNKDGTHLYCMGVFYTGFDWTDEFLGKGVGDSKNSAGQAAAKDAMQSDLVAQIKAKRKVFLEEREQHEKQQELLEEADKEKRKEERKRKDSEKAQQPQAPPT